MNRLPIDILQKYWGYTRFRPLQEEIINSILEGNDTLGLLPTGGGKSITFQVPTMVSDGLAVVITPIISLMKDQVDGLIARGIKATYLHSGLTFAESRHVIDKCLYGHCKFLYISPERLKSDRFIDSLRLMKVSLIVVDEAHCISQWGYDFRPSFLQIAKIRDIFPSVPILALTASATPEVVEDIMKCLKFRGGKLFSKSFERNNLSYVVRKCEDKKSQLIKILQSVAGCGIVYVRSRKKAREIALELKNTGIPADFYHARLSSEEKNDKQNKWIANQFRIMVATNAFGMGIDKPDVRIVIHADVPSCIEEYYQEAGRAGRDGNPSYVVLLCNNNDKSVLKKRISDAFPSREYIRLVYEYLGNFLDLALGDGENCTYEFNFTLFCKQNKFPVLPTFSALKLLSQAGYIEFIEEIETMSRVMIIVDKEELYNIDGDDEITDQVLRAILRTYTGLFADYVYIDEALISYRFHIKQEDIYQSLLRLNRKHILHYIPRRRTPYITYYSRRELPKYIQIPISVYEDRKRIVENRVNAMLNYTFAEKGCRENIILEYFGESPDMPCGRCDICRTEKARRRSEENIDKLHDSIMYMLSKRPRTINEIVETLPYQKDVVMAHIRMLIGEGVIRLENLSLILN